MGKSEEKMGRKEREVRVDAGLPDEEEEMVAGRGKGWSAGETGGREKMGWGLQRRLQPQNFLKKILGLGFLCRVF